MPQLIANAAGVATMTAYLDGLTISEGANAIVGRSVIVHAAPDDFKTQPTGNSGARQACGLIVRK
jgi:Cu-Zn family superoxide dismutase